MTDTLEYRIGRLSLAPGDILVVKSSEDIPMTHWKAVVAQFKELAPGTRLLFVSGDVELSVLTQAQIKARAAG